MMNNEVILTLAERFAARVLRDVGSEPSAQMVHAWTLAFGTPPAEDERLAGVGLLESQRTHFRQVAESNAANAKPNEKAPTAPSPELQALSLLCQALFSSNRFLYVD
jgi:hypothetical protein